MKHFGLFSVFCVSLLVLSSFALSRAYGEGAEFTEYDVKAGFIYNIAKFIDWPEGGNRVDGKETLELCILGSDPFGKSLDAIEGKIVKGRTFHVRRVASINELKSCHMVFIPRTERERVPRIAEAIKDYGILTVGDTEGFLTQGVMINFFVDGKRVRFEIDPERVKRGRINMSSQLLKLARIAGERQ